MRLFAHDPGTSNYGYAIVEGVKNGTGLRFRVIENGLVPVTIKNLKDHTQRRRQRDEYKEWVSNKIEEYNIKAMLGERYMTRGISGPTIESVNMMLGILQSFGLRDRYIPAAVWKNAVNRSEIDLKAQYKLCRTTPHQLDASLMGIYGLFSGFQFKDFNGQMTQRVFDAVVAQVEETSTERLINRKARV